MTDRIGIHPGILTENIGLKKNNGEKEFLLKSLAEVNITKAGIIKMPAFCLYKKSLKSPNEEKET